MKREKGKPTSVNKIAPGILQLNPADKQSYGILGLVLLVTVLVYLPSLRNGFVWDDEDYILTNRLLWSVNIFDIFSTYVVGNYHPLTILLHRFEYQLFGLNPAGYHVFNLIFHLVNVVLVFKIIFQLSKEFLVAIIVSLLFAIHPLHVESVAWISELKDLAYTTFFLASYFYYLKYAGGREKKYLYISLFMFLLSLLSKGMAVALPGILVLTDYLMGIKISRKTISEKIPFFILSFIFGVIAVFAQKSIGATDAIVFPFAQRMVFASFGFVSYLQKLILPLNLSAFYPYPIKVGGNIPALYYLFPVIAVAISGLVIYSLRVTKKIFFGFGFFTITIFLVLQLFPVGGAIMADRYSYVSSIGIFYLAGMGCNWAWRRSGRGIKYSTAILFSGVILFYSFETQARCKVWLDGISLWNSVIEKHDDISWAYRNRGIILIDMKKYDEALSDLNKAITLEPEYAKAYDSRGKLYFKRNEFDKALNDFNRALQLKPDYANSFVNRGNLYVAIQKYEPALNDFKAAINLQPGFSEAYNNLGSLYGTLNKYDEALNYFNTAIKLEPVSANAYFNRGILQENFKKYDEAVTDYNKAIDLQPDLTGAYIKLGQLYTGQNKLDDAILNYNKAIETDQQNADIYNKRGSVYLNMGQGDHALSDFTTAIELKPDFAVAYNNRGTLLMSSGKYDAAINDFSSAIRLQPGLAEAYSNRGSMYGVLGKNDEAILDFDKAIELQPNLAKAYCNRGILWNKKKSSVKAISDFNKAIEYQPDYAKAYYYRGVLQEESGDKTSACRDLKKSAELGFQPAAEYFSKHCQ